MGIFMPECHFMVHNIQGGNDRVIGVLMREFGAIIFLNWQSFAFQKIYEIKMRFLFWYGNCSY
ncbi:hypothetical protein AU510_01800 [Lonsdalea britannica]|nr:hypothetical protein AU510_01800 [Lonsdalea britannica]